MNDDLQPSDSRESIREVRSGHDFFSRLALVAFRLTLVCLAVALTTAFFALRSIGLWQFGGDKDASAESLAKLAVISLLASLISNFVAFLASVWGWRKGTSQPNYILWLSGFGVLAIGLFILVANR